MTVICTSCSAPKVRHHCEANADCTWLKCDGCGCIYDWQTDHGVDRYGKPLTA